jgi:hypothetical protein
MLKRKLPMAFNQTQTIFKNCLANAKLRLKVSAFTRERKLGAKDLLGIILLKMYKSLQLCLDDMYDNFDDVSVSKQAFSKARQQLNPEFVRTFADITGEIAATDRGETYRGMEVIGIDGSDVALENTPALKEAFGCSGSKKNAATALISIAFTPSTHAIYDCQIAPYKSDERDLAKLHIERLSELGKRGSLLLFDRWYPSAEFIKYCKDSGFHFVMRARRKWNVEADAIEKRGYIFLSNGVRVRVLKVVLPTGEIETLVTDLNQKQLPLGDAGALYFQRWQVETAYDLIKTKLQLENFSGKTEVAVKQDFYATIYLANLVAFAAEEADEVIKRGDEGKALKHKRKANRGRAINKLRKVFLIILLEPDEKQRDVLLRRLISTIARHPVSVVPGRSPNRKTPRKKRFYMTKKSVG